nr:uncharacterized protein LOC104113378 [Nicotiana tomentosiformis]
MVRKNRGIPKRGSSSKSRGYDLCHKCGKPGHFIKDCPLLKQDQYKHNTDKAVKRNRDVADNVVKQALPAWGDSSSKSGEDDEQELEKNMQLQEDLDRVKSDLEKSLKWTWSSDAITAMYTSNGGNIHGVGFQREKTSYNPHSKCVTILDNWLCTHCGNTGHFKENCKARIQSQQKNKVFVEKEEVKESSQKWYMDSGCPKHMTGSTNNFLSLKALQGGNFESLQNGNLTCLSAVDDNAELWHRRLSHASFTLLNKLVRKDLIRGLSMSSFKDHKIIKDETFPVFAAFVKKIQVKMSYNLVCIRSDHGTEFDNAKFDEFCAEMA